MTRLPRWAAQHLAGLRVVLVLTLSVGLLYPLIMTGIAQAVFGSDADGSRVTKDGQVVGSVLIGQSFADADGNPVKKYFQSRPSAAGDGYDPTATAASNQGPESVVDVLPDPADPESGKSEPAHRSLHRGATRLASWKGSTVPVRTAPPMASVRYSACSASRD